ncbi:MAG: bifunctional diaminohydroxyphosphoribosylaminopyrimidine deaminase/5-amino-6-(5-phosphoribosylamino)uracil reductase RibD [Deferribacterota bacterium]|nr:bifunctional diaminohydroxyphosphoribosylaminopyrimidine deaminase/5-amino-6-(5-phosphoribosylamino)uracil reductase RibD [Deferribacterota bacterium]
MNKCIAKALEYKGHTKLNPVVGAAVVKDGKIIAIDAHRRFGSKHAEVNVLEKAGNEAFGSDLYVTLEPCSVYSKTPPCVHKIVEGGIKRVFIGVADPNPYNYGKGISFLRDKGVEVYIGFQMEGCAKIIEDFTKYILRGEPYYIVKIAQSLDGKIATKNLDSRWITNSSSRAYVHYIRSTCDAILVGINTVKTDDPLLDVRFFGENVNNPKKVVLDAKLSIDESSNLVRKYPKDLIIFTGNNVSKLKVDKLKEKGVKVINCNVSDEGFIDLSEVSRNLTNLNILRVLVEGGSNIFGSFFDKNIADYAYFFCAPIIIGGRDGVSSVGGNGVDSIKDATKILDPLIQRFEDDIMIYGKIKDYSRYVIKKTEKVAMRCSQAL